VQLFTRRVLLMEKKRILNLLLISFLFIVIAYMVSGAFNYNSVGSGVNISSGVAARLHLQGNDSVWSIGGEVETINFTINFTGNASITGANITIPTGGYNIRFWNSSINATTDGNENFTRWRFYNRTNTVLSMENITQPLNSTLLVNRSLNIWFNVTATNGTEGVYDWVLNISDNSSASATETVTFRTYVDGLAPRITQINITDGTNTVSPGSGTNSTVYLKDGANLTVYATVNDSTFRVNDSVRVFFNIDFPASRLNGSTDNFTLFTMNVTAGGTNVNTPFLLKGIFNETSSDNKDRNVTSLIFVVNDSFNQVYVTEMMNFTIDKDSPAVTLTAPTTTTIDTSTSITYTCAATDLSPVTYSWTLTKPNSQTKTGTTTSITFTGADTQSAGTYSLTCTATDAVGHATTSATKQFTAHLTSSSSSGGSSGSSGGSSSGAAAEVKVDYNMDKEADATVEFSKKEGQSTTISLDSKTSHTVKFKKITSSSVTLVIQSDPVEITLSVGESKQLDLDGDGTNELEVSLESISGGAAKVVMKKIAQTSVEKTAPAPSETTPEATPSSGTTPTGGEAVKGSTSLTWLWALIIVVIIGAIIAVIMKKKKK